jgi:hypothetical protein
MSEELSNEKAIRMVALFDNEEVLKPSSALLSKRLIYVCIFQIPKTRLVSILLAF